MAFGPVRLLVVCAAGVLGCSGSAPVPAISAITPARGYTDRPVRLRIEGEGFLPTFQIDQGTGQRRGNVGQFWGRAGTGTDLVLLRDFDWLDKNTLMAWMEPGLLPGQHTVEVTDPRGQPARKEMAFWSLGPDDDRPVMTFEKPAPGTPVVGGTVLTVAISAYDPDPGVLQSLTWKALAGSDEIPGQACRLESDHTRARCDFQVVVPGWLRPGDQFVLRGVATDDSAAMNHTEQSMTFIIESPPTLAAVSPTRGGIVGGTDLVVRGSGFFPGTQVYIGDLLLLPHGGVVMDQQTIFGRAPAHSQGPATVLVRTPIGDAQLGDGFLYQPPPQIEAILPEVGDPGGGTAFRIHGHDFTSATQIFFGDTLVGAEPCEAQTVVSAIEITGFAPAGRGQTSVWAFDDELGWTRLPGGFGWSTP